MLLAISATFAGCNAEAVQQSVSHKIEKKYPLSQVDVGLIVAKENWKRGEIVPVNIEFTNISANEINLKIRSIRFYLSPAETDLTKIDIVAESKDGKFNQSKTVLPIKKNAIANLRFAVTESIENNGKSIFDGLPKGKYKLTAEIITEEPRAKKGETKILAETYEKHVYLQLTEGKTIENPTTDIAAKLSLNVNFSSFVWRKDEEIALDLEVKNISNQDVLLKIYSTSLLISGEQNGKPILGKFNLNIGEEATSGSTATLLKIPRGKSFKIQSNLANQPWSCLVCNDSSKTNWFENLDAGKYHAVFQIEVETGGKQSGVISTGGFEIKVEN
jgi:hypothetical protein